jgi:glutathione S-transferase
MKLYYSPGACSLAVRIIIHELNVASSYEKVDLRTKKTATGLDYLDINPKGSVPALCLDDHEILTENAAIQVYLAENFQGQHLLPGIADRKRYRILEWLNYVATELHKGCAPLFNPTITAELKESIFKPLLKKKLLYVNQSLKNDYLVGNSFTLPDAYLFVILTWMSHFEIDITPYETLNAYFQRLKSYPAIVSALKEENVSLD